MSTAQQNEGNTVSTTPPKKGSAAIRFFMKAHTALYRLSGGVIGGKFGKGPVLLLNTTGRKTGKQFTTPLLYLKDGEHYVLVASYGGSPKHPTWWLNLLSRPEAMIEVKKEKLSVRAAQADAEEKNRLWPLLVAMYPSYEGYQKRTTRDIPVVILTPIS